ncbi:MerR family transcriptional regulator [Paenibacillus endoradicis]|uniref:MerR family transcriptional regulator n=1 Tax=Paenibacillus endoradicis TaxID=2972487 RepID=UPI0021599C49|nr:MerR family transcriptional regulator [Paenibacillus endoradicis]MCR8656650.1 MerR family transcriptional regulator [Paenibacillus endoradicis]
MLIAEVSKKYDLSPDTLRYYEKIGLIPAVNRNSKGIRDYTDDDCRWVDFIKCMRSSGLPVATLIEYVRLYQQGDETIATRKNLLVEQRNQLALKMEEMKKVFERLDGKIDRYEQTILEKEKELVKM